jgi:hypothetical protein
MKLIKGLIKKNFPKKEKTFHNRKEKVLTISTLLKRQKVYLHFIESIHNDINAIVTVVNKENEEVERRYIKKQQLQEVVDKLSKQYKKPKISKPVRVLINIDIPKDVNTDKLKSKEKVREKLRQYAPQVYTNSEKFTKAFQQLVDCLDKYKLNFDLEYKSSSTYKYCVNMIPKSKNIAQGIHRIIIDIDKGTFTYFYGLEVSNLKLIHTTFKVSELFE